MEKFDLLFPLEKNFQRFLLLFAFFSYTIIIKIKSLMGNPANSVLFSMRLTLCLNLNIKQFILGHFYLNCGENYGKEPVP